MPESESGSVVVRPKSAILRWDRKREEAMWRFYVRWLFSPFVGFRKRWETTVYYLTLLLGGFGEFLVRELHLDVRAEEILWRVPLLVAVGIGTYRFILFPSKETEAAHERASEIEADASQREIAQERRYLDDVAVYKNEREALERRFQKLIERRPRVRIDFSYSGDVLGRPTPVPRFIVRNAGDIEARRVFIRRITFSDTHQLTFRKVDVVGIGPEDGAREMGITFHGVDFRKTNIPDFLVEAFFAELAADGTPLPAPETEATSKAAQLIKKRVYAAAGMADGSRDFRMTYYDVHGRRYVATFRLKFRIMGYHLVWAHVDLLSEAEPTTRSAKRMSA